MTAFALVVEKGRLQTSEFSLQRRSTTIGSAPMNDICIADSAVARVHAELRADDGGLAVVPVGTGLTAVNGKAVRGRTAVQDGDRVAIGQAYVFRIRRLDGGHAASSATGDRGAVANANRLSIPRWVIAYLVVMMIVFAVAAARRPSATGTLTGMRTDEVAYSSRHQLDGGHTNRMLSLITLAQIEERRGHAATAYELYRDALVARVPVDPRSPAYLFATRRMVAVKR